MYTLKGKDLVKEIKIKKTKTVRLDHNSTFVVIKIFYELECEKTLIIV